MKNNELFSTSTPTEKTKVEATEPPTKNEQLRTILGENSTKLGKLEDDLETQLSKMMTYIRNNNYLVSLIRKEKENYKNLIKRNQKTSDQLLYQILRLSRKRGIKDPSKIVEDLMKKHGYSD